jgi:UDP:flavonoid glycosyltransferase YjiC (YdhE family)
MARELVQRGHRVVFAMPKEGASWVQDSRIEVASWEPRGLEKGQLTGVQRQVRAEASRQRSWHHGQYLVTRSMAVTYAPVFRAMQVLVRELNPRIVITPQTMVPAMDAAVERGTLLAISAFYLPPSVRTASVCNAFRSSTRLSWLRQLDRLIYGQRERLAWASLDRIRRRYSRCCSYGELFRRHCVISATHRCVEASDTFLPNVHLAGPLIAEPQPLPASLAQWLDQSREPDVIFVAFGTLVGLEARQIRALVSGLHQAGRRVLWAIPDAQQRMLPHLPNSFRIESYVDQRSVLAHPSVSAFVSHGGGNSFMESMRCGKPMLVSPFMLDQPFYAARAAALGVGIRMEMHEMVPAMIRDRLIRLLRDRSFATNAGRLSQILQNAGGPSRAAEIVEHVAEDRPLLARSA